MGGRMRPLIVLLVLIAAGCSAPTERDRWLVAGVLVQGLAWDARCGVLTQRQLNERRNEELERLKRDPICTVGDPLRGTSQPASECEIRAEQVNEAYDWATRALAACTR